MIKMRKGSFVMVQMTQIQSASKTSDRPNRRAHDGTCKALFYLQHHTSGKGRKRETHHHIYWDSMGIDSKTTRHFLKPDCSCFIFAAAQKLDGKHC